MIVTQKNKIRGLSKIEFKILKRMCHESKALYNTSLYYINNYFDINDEYLGYDEMAFILKTNEHYKMLYAACSQQILKVVDREFRSFFHVIKERKKGNYNRVVKTPKYLPKDSLFLLIYPSQKLKINDGKMFIPLSKKMRKETCKKGITIKVPNYITTEMLCEVRIAYRYNHFEIEFIYEKQEKYYKFDENKILTIDVGLDNLLTNVDCISGRSFIIDGRELKSYNRWYNKRVAKYQSIVNKQNITKRTKWLKALDGKRYWFINDYLNQCVNKIIKYCLENKIGTIVIGENKEWKQGINIGKRNNQNFMSIPHGILKYKIKCKCEFHGIKYITQEESYTSKCSFLDDESIEKHEYYLGKRITRGLFKSSEGILLNADVNGALNICRKSKQKINNNNQLCIGLSSSPVRVRVHSIPSRTKNYVIY